MTTSHNDSNFPSHPLDGALRAYFRQQVPNPWPACRALDGGPRPVPPGPRVKAGGTSGRAVLAIAAAALLGIGILLSSGFPNSKPTGPATDPGSLNGVTADGSHILPPPKKVGPMGDSDLPLN
jgi:hypothetical protein